MLSSSFREAKRGMINKGNPMAQKLDDSELVTFKELLMANSIQVDAAVQLLIEKGFFTQDEFFAKLKQVPFTYQRKTKLYGKL